MIFCISRSFASKALDLNVTLIPATSGLYPFDYEREIMICTWLPYNSMNLVSQSAGNLADFSRIRISVLM